MSPYRHSQVGWVTIVAVVPGMGLAAAVCWHAPDGCAGLAFVLAVLAVCLLVFHKLTVTVLEDRVVVEFGTGLVGRTVLLREVRAVRVVRNRWWYGWGIHWFPGGWMFNVSGFDAVELELGSGRLFRIGTDQPWQLCDAIEKRLGPPVA